MDLKRFLWFIISHLMMSGGQYIGVILNNTIILDNSTINWNDANTFQCGISSTQNPIEIFTTVQSTNLYTCANGLYGIYCNTSSAMCDIINPCFNGGICHSNSSLSAGYFCQCSSGFSGYDCQDDNRICMVNTCWNNGTCIEINTTVANNIQISYLCQCVYGYEGSNCQLETDLCGNITCQYDGICISSYLAWFCRCLDSSLYSGTYCEDKSSSLVAKQILSRSLAIVAIVALCLVVAFVMLMDILKYVFKIDPIDRERYRLRLEQEKKEQNSFGRKKKTTPKKKKKTPRLIITRFSTI